MVNTLEQALQNILARNKETTITITIRSDYNCKIFLPNGDTFIIEGNKATNMKDLYEPTKPNN